MNRFVGMRASASILWLIALWVLLWGNLSVANVLSGFVVALFVLTVARLPRLARRRNSETARVHPLALAHFVLYVLIKLIQSNLSLAWEIVTPTNTIRNGVIRVPLRTTSPISMTVVANVITLTPGTMTIEAKGEPPVLYVNVLHLHKLETVRRDLLHLEVLAVRAFGSLDARRQLTDELDRITSEDDVVAEVDTDDEVDDQRHEHRKGEPS